MTQVNPAYKSVWISTPPRTGSMWLFNVTREMLRRVGRTVLPEKVPQMDTQMIELARCEAWNDTDPRRVWVLKVHTLLAREVPKSRIVTIIRDPRDVLVSYRRFMHTTFEHAMDITEQTVVRFADAYADYPPELLFHASYLDIEKRPADLLRRMVDYLDLAITPEAIAQTVEKFSRAKVRQLIEKTSRRVMHRIKRQAPVNRDEVVVLGQDNIRAFDPNTGFQTGHISGSRSGDWRTELSEREKRIIRERIGGWIVRHGFPPD
jgi:hypothetical protein